MKKLCSIKGCENKHKARSWCRKHYGKWRIYGNPLGGRFLSDSVQDRFEEKYIPVTESGCWIWTAATSDHGYGQVRVKNKMEAAHRVSWTLYRGPIPAGMCVLHKCDVPSCVNPDHLFLGSQNDNMDDMVVKGRSNKLYGERHYRAKITEKQALEIKISIGTHPEIAANYSIGRCQVGKIKSGKSWSHI